MKVLLLGGMTGMLSYDIAQTLQEYQIPYIPISRNNIPFDNEQGIAQILSEHTPTHVINTIAYTQVDQAEIFTQEAYDVNVRFTEYLARACYIHDAILIHYSTDFIFNGLSQRPYKEHDVASPLCVYGVTKYQGEQKVQQYCPTSYIIRTAWLFGIAKANFITKIITRVREQNNLGIVADQSGSPTYTKDLAQASLPFLKNNIEYGIYHVTNQGEASWFHLAHYAVSCYNELMHSSYEIRPILSQDYPQQAQRPSYSALDTQHYIEITGNKLPHWREATYNFILKYVQQKDNNK